MDDKKIAKKESNRKYYEKIKEKLKTLDEIKKMPKDEKDEDDFFFQKQPTIPATPAKVTEQPQIIVQAPAPVKSSLKNKVMETMIISIIPIIPMLIKQFLITFQARQEHSHKNTSDGQETHLKPRYVPPNYLDF